MGRQSFVRGRSRRSLADLSAGLDLMDKAVAFVEDLDPIYTGREFTMWCVPQFDAFFIQGEH